jgi:hypothetical protein
MTVVEATAPDRQKMILDFLRETGYGPSDLLSLNYETRIFLMRNGGKYIFQADGTVTHLAGPSEDPSERL